MRDEPKVVRIGENYRWHLTDDSNLEERQAFVKFLRNLAKQINAGRPLDGDQITLEIDRPTWEASHE